MKYSKFKNSEQSQGLLFWQVSTLWARKIKQALRPYDLTHTQFVVLAVTQALNDMEQDATQKKISDFSMIDVMTVSSTLRLLQKKNLVCREEHSTDTRAKQITNTAAGQEMLKRIVPIIEKVDALFFAPISSENEQFMTQLNKLKKS